MVAPVHVQKQLQLIRCLIVPSRGIIQFAPEVLRNSVQVQVFQGIYGIQEHLRNALISAQQEIIQ